jgi:hypothetical protein
MYNAVSIVTRKRTGQQTGYVFILGGTHWLWGTPSLLSNWWPELFHRGGGGGTGRGMKLTTHLDLLPKLRKNGAVAHHMPLWFTQGKFCSWLYIDGFRVLLGGNMYLNFPSFQFLSKHTAFLSVVILSLSDKIQKILNRASSKIFILFIIPCAVYPKNNFIQNL